MQTFNETQKWVANNFLGTSVTSRDVSYGTPAFYSLAVTDVQKRSVRERSMTVVKHVWCWLISLVLSLSGFSFTGKAGISERPGQKEHLSSYQQADMHWKGKMLVVVETANNKSAYVKNWVWLMLSKFNFVFNLQFILHQFLVTWTYNLLSLLGEKKPTCSLSLINLIQIWKNKAHWKKCLRAEFLHC